MQTPQSHPQSSRPASPIQTPLLFIGGGTMAHAIYAGATQAGVLDPALVAVLDPNESRHPLFGNAFAAPDEAINWLASDSSAGCMIVLAVKPQMLGVATDPIRPLLDSSELAPTVISILAGTRSESLANAMGPTSRIVRVMPNTPSQIGQGISAIAPSTSSTQADIDLAKVIMSAVGETVDLDESMMDAFTAVAGSGPAYVFYLVEAMTKAAESLGFDPAQARTIVEQTVIGSSALLADSADDASNLRARVTSKNGTTHAATTTLDTLGVMDAFTKALTAARDRGIELAGEG